MIPQIKKGRGKAHEIRKQENSRTETESELESELENEGEGHVLPPAYNLRLRKGRVEKASKQEMF